MKPKKDAKDLLERARMLHQNELHKQAEALYRHLLARSPNNHAALYQLGLLLGETGQGEASLRHLERAVALSSNPAYLMTLGEAHRRGGRPDLAAECFGRILEVEPDFPEARLNLAITVAGAGMYADAESLLEQALAQGEDGARLRRALSSLSLRKRALGQAVAHAERAVELTPSVASGYCQLADALDASGQKSRAIESYRRALELDPSDWGAHSDLIVAMLASPDHDDRKRFEEARAWSKRHGEALRSQIRPLANGKDPERRLRIGYVSPDFRSHAVQQFLIPLLKHHDPGVCEVFLYSSVDRPDAETGWYRSFAGGRFREIRGLDDVRAAELIRADGIDILVDLALHSRGGRLRLFACRPAPVQMCWLGYVGTTGLDEIDYRITDPFVDPPGADVTIYSETCLRLPETSWCYASLMDDLPVGALTALSHGFITFGGQIIPRKVHDGVFAVWARVLRAVPDSRLFLYADGEECELLRQKFADLGVDGARLEFGPRVSRRDYLERYRRIDIGLDTWPFNGATTTLDSAWMGVPVITLSGAASLQRAGACIASNLGLPELIAYSEDEFVEKAVALAGSLERLSELRARLRPTLEASPLGDAPRFARHLEQAYRDAWRRYCAGRAAAGPQ